jgi:thiosulfate reductase/polysulfide reductase chain A
MSTKKVYSVCGMCTVRCPIQVEVKDGSLAFLQGNLHADGIKGAVCARGAAGPALVNDNERPQFPMIREGERGISSPPRIPHGSEEAPWSCTGLLL